MEAKMSEGITTGIYDTVNAVKDLNDIEGFDPRKFMRVIPSEDGKIRYYLEVAYRKLWYRLKYPEGKIVKRILKLTDQVAVIEARVYLNRNDPEESYISSALAQKYYSNEQFGMKYVELAETAAVGRALSDAGFGLQFADLEGEIDPEVVDAPIDEAQLKAAGRKETEKEAEADLDQETMDDNLPGQYDISSYIPMPDETQDTTGNNMERNDSERVENGIEEQRGKESQEENRPVQQKKGRNREKTDPVRPGKEGTEQRGGKPVQQKTLQQELRKDMPVEEIYSRLDQKAAENVVISIRFGQGKTLGQMARENPKALEWYATQYGGPDNLLRAASRFLLDLALKNAG